ncbi:MAG: hypothetical protein Q8M94_08745, partial [Ignavibacteria bacterium]|nr:hypothetical protein [Ignavibacteria bacterium]
MKILKEKMMKMIDPEIAMQLYDPAAKKQTTAYYRNKAYDAAESKQYAQAAKYYELAIKAYPDISGQLAKDDIMGLKKLQKQMEAHARYKPYDPNSKKRKGGWLDFVKAHKDIRLPSGLLDLKAISKLWKDKKERYRPHVILYDPAPKRC